MLVVDAAGAHNPSAKHWQRRRSERTYPVMVILLVLTCDGKVPVIAHPIFVHVSSCQFISVTSFLPRRRQTLRTMNNYGTFPLSHVSRHVTACHVTSCHAFVCLGLISYHGMRVTSGLLRVCCGVQVAPGMLITFLQKGLAYVGIEEHLNEVMAALSSS